MELRAACGHVHRLHGGRGGSGDGPNLQSASATVAQPDETPRKPIVIPYLEGAGHCTGQGMAGATAPGTGELGVPSLDTAQTTHTRTRTLLPAFMYNKYVLPHLPTPTHETRV